MTSIFIIILNFNGGEETIDCLNSIMDSDYSRMNANIVVVDNGSRDGSLEKLKVQSKKFKVKKLIENQVNLGFAAGMNVGIKYALKNGADAVLLLNQDTVVEKGFLEPLLKNPADIAAPVIKFKRKGEWVYDFGGRVNWRWGRPEHEEFLVSVVPPSEESTTFVGTPRRRDFSHLRGGPFDKLRTTSQEEKIDYVSGCAMLIKRSVFEKIGLLDEKFFLYFEDIDFCLRARKAGFKIAVEPKSVIIHKLSEKKKKPLKQHLSHLKSNLVFVNRYVPLYRRPIAYVYLLLLLFKVVWNQI